MDTPMSSASHAAKLWTQCPLEAFGNMWTRRSATMQKHMSFGRKSARRKELRRKLPRSAPWKTARHCLKRSFRRLQKKKSKGAKSILMPTLNASGTRLAKRPRMSQRSLRRRRFQRSLQQKARRSHQREHQVSWGPDPLPGGQRTRVELSSGWVQGQEGGRSRCQKSVGQGSTWSCWRCGTPCKEEIPITKEGEVVISKAKRAFPWRWSWLRLQLGLSGRFGIWGGYHRLGHRHRGLRGRNKLFAQGDVPVPGFGNEATGWEAIHPCIGAACACAWHSSNGCGKAIAVCVQAGWARLDSHLRTTRIVPSAWVQEGTSDYDWWSFQDRHGFSWATCKGKGIEGASLAESTEDGIGSEDDDPVGNGQGSSSLPTAAAPTQREKEEHFVSHYPCRSWCEHCIRGTAKAMRHVRVDHSHETVPVISAEYFFEVSRWHCHHAKKIIKSMHRSW